MKLHPVINNHGGRLWCAHAALSAITGLPTKDCLHYLKIAAKEVTYRKRKLQGVYPREIIRGLLHFGYEVKTIHDVFPQYRRKEPIPNNTLIHHCANFAGDKVYLVMVPWHFIAAQGFIVSDSNFLEGVHINYYPGKSRQVIQVWEVRNQNAADL